MFDIIMNRQVVGNARVDKEGLFYKIHCTCKVPDEAFYKIYMNDGEINRDLGICVPSGDFFVLTARVPCKQIKVESLSFSLEPKQDRTIVVPLATDEPFNYLEKLEAARFQTENGQPEIVINSVQDLLDSDRSQESLNKWESL